MRVSRLEVFGFKSFMDRLALPLNGGITGVVGPNGCGKSNIVDALRWVLGETRARNLRGAIAEDVIFNGTEKLRPLGLAEVSITLTSQNKNFFEDVLSPGLEADQVIQSVEFESELDSAEDLATLDIADDTNKEELANEDQTKDENTRPRFTVIDGGKDGARGDDANDPDIKQDQSVTASNGASSLADKFSWLRTANEVQITRRLYRSGESEYFINRVPCRLKDMVDLFRAVGMGARAYNIVAQGEISRIVTAKPEEKRTIIEEAAGVLGFRDRIAATNRRLKETETNIARIEDIVKEVSRNVTTLKRQATKAKNRESLRATIVDLESKIFTDRLIRLGISQGSLSQEFESAKDSCTNLEVVLSKVQAEEGEVRSKLMGIDVESDALRSKIDSIREELNNRERERQSRKARLQELIVLEAAAETEIKRLKERELTLNERKGVCEKGIESLAKSEEEISTEISGIESGSHDDLKNAATVLDTAREALRSIDQEIRTVRERLVADESRLTALTEQLKAASPATRLKETLGEEGKEYLSRSHGLIVDGIKVPENFARAIQGVLAEKASFLVSDDPKSLSSAFVTHALSSDGSNKKGLALGVFKSGSGLPYRQPSLRAYCGDAVKPALDVIEIAASYELSARNLFADVYCANTIDDANAFLDKIAPLELPVEPVVVTAEGDILTRYSFFSFRHEGGLVQLKNQILKLEQTVAEAKDKLAILDQKRQSQQEELGSAQERHQLILSESQRRTSLVKELSQKLGSSRGRLQSERRLIDQIIQDLDKTTNQIAEVHSKIQKFRQDQESVKAQISDEVTTEEQELQKELSTLIQQSNTIEARRREGRDELSQHSNRVVQARSELDSARSTTSQLALELQKVELEINHLKESVLEHLGEDSLHVILSLPQSEQENSLLTPELLKEYQEEVSKLRTRMIREGEVDPESIQQYEDESKRLEDLENQKRDLQEAFKTLTRTVDRLVEISQERFLKTFEGVNKNFSELVPKIFGGGSARLELTDPSNLLETGVEIIARPPGKKLKSIELLSGGEKTLCAISLIIAMFLERPSPICVLDEVDAPLDEANVVRFLSFVKEMSNKTQFLLITHNKQTMSVCDHLVGVTMEQPGASKVVTVSLEEAYNHALNE